MRKFKNEEKKQYNALTGLVGVVAITIIAIITCIFMIIQIGKSNDAEAELKIVTESKTQNIHINHESVAIDSTGNPSETEKANTALLHDIFYKTYQYVDGESFVRNRASINEMITDKTFAELIMPDPIRDDINQIDTSEIKSEHVQTDIYSTSAYSQTESEYIVMVTHYLYKNPEDLANKRNKLVPQYKAYRITVENNSIIKGREIKGMRKVN